MAILSRFLVVRFSRTLAPPGVACGHSIDAPSVYTRSRTSMPPALVRQGFAPTAGSMIFVQLLASGQMRPARSLRGPWPSRASTGLTVFVDALQEAIGATLKGDRAPLVELPPGAPPGGV